MSDTIDCDFEINDICSADPVWFYKNGIPKTKMKMIYQTFCIVTVCIGWGCPSVQSEPRTGNAIQVSH